MNQAPATGPLSVQALSHAFGPHSVLEDISLALPAGQTVALVGPSGSGKTTLLHLCAGLLTVREGQVSNPFKRTGLLFQQARLLPWKSALDNIALGLKARGMPRTKRLQRARSMARAMGLDDWALQQFPTQLSGGMQSRAALARALVLQPELLLLDEPFSALDIGLKQQLYALLLQAQQDSGMAVLMITHDVMEAVTLADQILVLGGAPGRLRWQLDLPVDKNLRSPDWIHRQTALLLSQPAVRQAFELPTLAQAAGDASTTATPDLAVGHALDAAADAGRSSRSACEAAL